MNKLNIKGQVQKGFTLIELMIAMAILGILSSFAISSYRDYIIQTKLTDGLVVIQSVMKRVSEFTTTEGRFPSSFNELGMTKPRGIYIRDIELQSNGIHGGYISITFNEKGGDELNNKFVRLYHPVGTQSNNHSIKIWVFSGGTVSGRYLKDNFANINI